jgi:hypothetical protein
MERVFTPRSLHDLMERQGFAVRRHDLFCRGLAALPAPLYALLLPLRGHAGWNGRFARRQLMVASPR